MTRYLLLLACGAACLARAAAAQPLPAATPSPPPLPSLSSPPSSPPACSVLSPGLQDGYAGQCRDGLAHGQGLASGPDGRYQGEFVHGLREGPGILYYANGDIYAGQWLADRRAGTGTYWFGTASPWRGDRYQGQWRDDRYDGRGLYTFGVSGDTLRARWQQGFADTPPTAAMVQRDRAGRRSTKLTIGAAVCSVTTPGSWPGQIAHATVAQVDENRKIVLVKIEDRAVLAASPLFPAMRWESRANWQICR